MLPTLNKSIIIIIILIIIIIIALKIIAIVAGGMTGVLFWQSLLVGINSIY